MQRRGWGTKSRTVAPESRVPHIYWNAFASVRYQSQLSTVVEATGATIISLRWCTAGPFNLICKIHFVYLFFFFSVLSLMITRYSSSELPRCWDLATSLQKIFRCRKLKWTQYNYYNRVFGNSNVLDQKSHLLWPRVYVLLSVRWSLFLPLWASPAFSVSALVDFRRGSCLSAILRQSPDPGVKECEPGGCDDQDLSSGRTMLNTSANALMISQAFCVPPEHTFFLRHSIMSTLKCISKKK